MKLNGVMGYRDRQQTGVDWLGDIPAHWELKPARGVFREVDQTGHPEEEMLSVTISQGVIKQRDLLQDSSKKDSSRLDKSGYKLVHPGDIAYNKMRAWQGAIGVSSHRGIVSPAYVVQRPRKGNHPDYLHHILRTPNFAKEAERWSYGIASDMWSLRPEHFRLIPFCVPPYPEQRAIARYLDYMDSRIQRYIKAKERLVELLEEQKRAVINQAVTRGLDPDVPLKPSGVEWLGDVPAHWEFRQLRTVAKILNGATPSTNVPEYWNGDIDWITPDDLGRLSNRYVENSGRRISSAGYAASGTRLAPPGSIALSTRAPIGHLGLLKTEACVNQGCRLLTPMGKINSEFLYLALLAAKEELNSLGQGSTFTELSRGKLAGFKLLVPPSDEQAKIVEHVDGVTHRCESHLSKCHRQIELIKEYRTRLIADVVTGKLDVREAAAGLADDGVGVVDYPGTEA